MISKRDQKYFLSAFLFVLLIMYWISPLNVLTNEQKVFEKKELSIGQKGQIGSITREFSITGRNREVVEFEVNYQGKIEAKAEWSGTARTLSLILNGPGMVQAYARQEGSSPLTLTFEVTPRILSLGKMWKVSVVNFESKTSAQGKVYITYPGSPEISAIEPSISKKERPVVVKEPDLSVREPSGEVRWSSIGQKESEPDRKHKPPSPDEPADIQKPAKSFQLKRTLVRVNRLTPIDFKPFSILDPGSGKPISPETFFTLPNKTKLSANKYYEELNRLEKGFNDLGYSLDVRRDPKLQVKLQEISISRAEIAQNSERAKMILNTHKFPTRPLPKTVEVLRQDFRTRLREDKNRLMRLQKHRYPGHGSDSPEEQQARTYEKPLQTPKYEYGYRDVFAVFFNGKASLSGSLSEARITSEAEAVAYAFDNKVSLLRMSGSTFAPSSGGTMKANLTIYIAGIAHQILDQSMAIPSVPLDQLPSIPSLDLSDEWSRSADESFNTYFPLGPILLSVKIGIRFSAGIGYGLFLSPLYASGQLGPFVASDVYAQAGIDIIIAEAGVSCSLILLDNTLTLEAGLGLDADERGPYFEAKFLIYDEFESLSGELSLYACIYVPAFDLPPWKKKCWDWEIAKWEGLQAKGYIIPETQEKFYIYEGGPAEVTEEEAGKEFEVSGELAGKWYPEEGSIADEDLKNQAVAPALAVFNNRLYKIWSGIGSSSIFYSSTDGTVAYKVEKKTKKVWDGERRVWMEFPYTVRTPYLVWSEAELIPEKSNTSLGRVAACVFRDRLYIFHVGVHPDKNIYYRSMGQDGTWRPENGSVRILQCYTLLRPAVTVYQDNLWLCFKSSSDETIHFRWADGTVGDDYLLAWTGTVDHILAKTSTKTEPAACVFGDALFVFFKGANNNNIYYRYLRGTWCYTNKSIEFGGKSSRSAPGVIVFNNRLYMIHIRGNGSISYCSCGQLRERSTNRPCPHLESGRAEITGSFTYEQPSLCVFKNKIYLFHRSTYSNDIFCRWLATQ